MECHEIRSGHFCGHSKALKEYRCAIAASKFQLRLPGYCTHGDSLLLAASCAKRALQSKQQLPPATSMLPKCSLMRIDLLLLFAPSCSRDYKGAFSLGKSYHRWRRFRLLFWSTPVWKRVKADAHLLAETLVLLHILGRCPALREPFAFCNSAHPSLRLLMLKQTSRKRT